MIIVETIILFSNGEAVISRKGRQTKGIFGHETAFNGSHFG